MNSICADGAPLRWRVVSSTRIHRRAGDVWPLLCDAVMDTRIPCVFRLGIPKPVQCRLPDGVGGVGARRECVSNRGVHRYVFENWARLGAKAPGEEAA